MQTAQGCKTLYGIEEFAAQLDFLKAEEGMYFLSGEFNVPECEV